MGRGQSRSICPESRVLKLHRGNWKRWHISLRIRATQNKHSRWTGARIKEHTWEQASWCRPTAQRRWIPDKDLSVLTMLAATTYVVNENHEHPSTFKPGRRIEPEKSRSSREREYLDRQLLQRPGDGRRQGHGAQGIRVEIRSFRGSRQEQRHGGFQVSNRHESENLKVQLQRSALPMRSIHENRGDEFLTHEPGSVSHLLHLICRAKESALSRSSIVHPCRTPSNRVARISASEKYEKCCPQR